MTKNEALRVFLLFDEPRDRAMSVLTSDTDNASYTLTADDLKHVLNKFSRGEIDADALEMWALFVESREEVNAAAVEGYIYALANPDLMGEINGVTVRRMLTVL